MKNSRYLLLTIATITLIGCGRETAKPDASTATEMATDSIAETDTATKTDTATEIDAADKTETEADSEVEADVVNDTLEEEIPSEADEANIASEPKYITIDFSETKETHVEGDAVTPLNLRILLEEYNDIDWAYEWYERENLSLPMIGNDWNQFYDESYEYQWNDEELYIYEKETGNCLYVLQYPTDRWYTNGNNAYLKDGIFYGSSVLNGYAQPDSCFMFAYDLENDKLLWRSADQSYNSMNFVVKGDIIICGYGFTSEDDYLYQINRNTGEIVDRLKLKKKPDLLVEQDGKLYVHTYSYDYVIEMD